MKEGSKKPECIFLETREIHKSDCLGLLYSMHS